MDKDVQHVTEDIQAIKNVIALIDKIDTNITLESFTEIFNAYNAYKALATSEQTMIGNKSQLFHAMKRWNTIYKEVTSSENSGKNKKEIDAIKELVEQHKRNSQQSTKVEEPKTITEEKEENIAQQDNNSTQVIAEWRANRGGGSKQNGTLVVFNKDEQGELITRHVKVIGLTGEVFEDVTLTMALSYCGKGYMPDKNTSSGYDKYKLFIRGTETPVFEKSDTDKTEPTHDESTEQQQAAAYVQSLLMKHQMVQPEVQPESVTPAVKPPVTNPVIPPVTNPVIPPVKTQNPVTKRAKTSVDKTAYNGRDTDMYLTEPSYIPGVTKTSGNGLQAYVLDRATAEKSHVKSAFKNDKSFQLGGVYVLFNNNEVYYVGQQKPGSTTSRIINHTDTKRDNHTDWDNAVFVVSEDFNNDACDVFELLLISKLAPTDNNTKGNTGTAQAAYKKNTSYYNKKCEQILDIIAKAGIKLAVRAVDESKLQSKVLSDWFSGVTTTPELIASQMVEMIPEEKFYPDSKFLCFAAKDGIFASLLFDKLMQAPMFIKQFENKKARAAYIRENVLYIAFCSEIKKSYIPDIKDNLVKCVSDAHMIQLPDSVYLKTYDKHIDEQVCKTLSIEGDTTMQFDVVIGNPPYNKDMYLGFCENAFSLLKPDGVMVQITPASWQGDTTKQYLSDLQSFRRNIMPHMSDIVFYPDSTDIFDIALAEGISVFKTDRAATYTDKHKQIIEHDNTLLDEIAPLFEGTDANDKKGYVYISKAEQELLARIRTNFVSLMSETNTWQFKPAKPAYTSQRASDMSTPEQRRKRGSESHYDANSNIKVFGVEHTIGVPVRVSKLKTLEGIEDYKVVTSARTYQNPRFTWVLFGPNEIPGGQDALLGYGTKEQCESIASYYDSDLIWYLCKRYHNALISLTTFEYVPALPEGYTFDHIYTNEEIFDIFQLTPEERNLITSVIKERKKK